LYLVLIQNAENAHRNDLQHYYLKKLLEKYTLPVIAHRIKAMEKEKFPLVDLDFEKLKKGVNLAVKAFASDFSEQEL